MRGDLGFEYETERQSYSETARQRDSETARQEGRERQEERERQRERDRVTSNVYIGQVTPMEAGTAVPYHEDTVQDARRPPAAGAAIAQGQAHARGARLDRGASRVTIRRERERLYLAS